MTEPKINPKLATDLDQAKLDSTRRETAVKLAAEKAESERMAAIQEQARQWDNAMQRAFKGIMPRPTRHRMLREAVRDEA